MIAAGSLLRIDDMMAPMVERRMPLPCNKLKWTGISGPSVEAIRGAGRHFSVPAVSSRDVNQGCADAAIEDQASSSADPAVRPCNVGPALTDAGTKDVDGCCAVLGVPYRNTRRWPHVGDTKPVDHRQPMDNRFRWPHEHYRVLSEPPHG